MSDPGEEPRAACASCAIRGVTAVGRREFLSATMLVAVAAVLEACGLSTDSLTGPSGGALTVKLSSFPSLARVGGIARVDNGNGSPTALVRTASTTFVGVTMVCTHQGTTVNISGAGFLCPNHGARYDATGTWQGGQRANSLATFVTTFDGTDTVTIARPA